MPTKTPKYNVDVDETADLVFGGECEIAGGSVSNAHSAMQFLKLYDAAAAGDVTVGTTVPKITIAVPPAGAVQLWPMGFANGIVAACTANAADNDTTEPTGVCVLSLSIS